MPKASYDNVRYGGKNSGGLGGSPAITRKGNASAGTGYLGIPARARSIAVESRLNFQSKWDGAKFSPKSGRLGQSRLLRGLIDKENAILATTSAKTNIQQSQPFNPAIQ